MIAMNKTTAREVALASHAAFRGDPAALVALPELTRELGAHVLTCLVAREVVEHEPCTVGEVTFWFEHEVCTFQADPGLLTALGRTTARMIASDATWARTSEEFPPHGPWLDLWCTVPPDQQARLISALSARLRAPFQPVRPRREGAC